MGTGYYFDGSISIEPPLNFSEIEKAREIALGLVQNGYNKKHATQTNIFQYMPLMPKLEASIRKTPEGILHVTTAAELAPTCQTDGGYSHLMCDLVEQLIKGLPGHNWSGTVMAMDEYRHSAIKIVVTTGEDTSTVEEVSGTVLVQWADSSEPTPVTEIF